MKLLHILAQLPCGTGSGVYFTNLIKELARYGHEQRAVFALQDQHTFPLLPEGAQYPVRFKTEELPFPVPGMSDVMPYDSGRYCAMTSEMMELWTRAFRLTLERATADFQPDALILHHLWILTSLALEVFPNVKSIGICHYTDLRQAMLNPEIKRRHVANIHRLDTILSLSDLHHEEIREIHHLGHAKIVTMGGGFDDTLFFPNPNKRRARKVKILYAGKIDPSKGIFELIEAFSSLRERDDELELSVVGAPTREHMDRLHGLLKGNEAVRVRPPLSQAQLAQTMREHDVFVMPSFYEGLGVIAVEALASGLWTVATKIEGLASLLGERVVQAGAIEFVSLPDTGRAGVPRESQLRAFVQELAMKLSRQVDRARRGGFPEDICDEISRRSWAALAARVQGVIVDCP